jgi:DMSO reductase family type II enzyme heme b subunit
MWSSDRPGDVEEAYPNMVVDLYPLAETAATAEFDRPATQTASQDEVALPAAAVGNLIVPQGDGTAAAALEMAGPGTTTFRPVTSQLVEARGKWADGRWTVVLTRDLAVPDGQGAALAPGERVSVAFAVWDGAAGDRGGQKLITIWQDLVLEP